VTAWTQRGRGPRFGVRLRRGLRLRLVGRRSSSSRSSVAAGAGACSGAVLLPRAWLSGVRTTCCCWKPIWRLPGAHVHTDLADDQHRSNDDDRDDKNARRRGRNLAGATSDDSGQDGQCKRIPDICDGEALSGIGAETAGRSQQKDANGAGMTGSSWLFPGWKDGAA